MLESGHWPGAQAPAATVGRYLMLETNDWHKTSIATVGRFLVDGSPEHPRWSAPAVAATAHGLHTTGWLLSFWYYRTRDLNLLHPDCPLIADSGAFSAYTLGGNVTVADYSAWLARWKDRFRFAFNLDVMGDPDASFTQWLQLRADGHDTVPVIHYGTRPEHVLPRYLEHGAARVAMGGIVVPGDHGQRRAWVAYTFRWLRDHAPGVDVHGLGVHMSSPILGRFPWTSTDSSSPGAAWRFGRCKLWDPDRARWVVFDLDGRQAHKHGRVIRGYGFEPGQVAESRPRHPG